MLMYCTRTPQIQVRQEAAAERKDNAVALCISSDVLTNAQVCTQLWAGGAALHAAAVYNSYSSISSTVCIAVVRYRRRHCSGAGSRCVTLLELPHL
jgi:hypothetical protein